MKTFFVEAEYDDLVEFPDGFSKDLPENIGLFTTVQYIKSIPSLKKQLEKTGKKVSLFKPIHAKYEGQILGCNVQRFKGVDAFVYVGDGLFHPKALVMENNLDVYAYNPNTEKISKVTVLDVDKIRKKERGALLKFLTSEKIGVLVTVKHGQNLYNQSKMLEKRYPEKTFYYLAFDTIDFSQLENFPFIQCFVNSACPRIGLDDHTSFEKPVVNLRKIFEMENEML